MKTLALSLLTLLCFFTTPSARAQCPPGWTTATPTFVINPSCSITVTICYICSPSGGSPTTILIAGWYQSGPCSGVDFGNDFIVSLFIQHYDSFCTITDCRSGCTDFIVDIPACRQWYYNYNPPLPLFYWWEPCSSSSKHCTVTTSICRDSQTGSIIECGSRSYGSYGISCATAIPPPSGTPSPSGNHIPYGVCNAGDSCP